MPPPPDPAPKPGAMKQERRREKRAGRGAATYDVQTMAVDRRRHSHMPRLLDLPSAALAPLAALCRPETPVLLVY
jgi:hypothetical protein